MLLDFFKKDQSSPLDSLIDALLDEMNDKGVYSSDYPDMLTKLERLYALKAEQRQAPVSRDTIAHVVGSLLGILIIVIYEEKHVMTSKGFSWIPLRNAKVNH